MSGAAAAEVALSGSAVAGLKNNGTDTTLHYEIDLDIAFSGATDNGLTFGASLELDEINTATTTCEFDTADDQPEECVSTDRFGGADPEIFISGAFGTLTLGAIDPVLDNVGLADVGFDGIGVDDGLEGLRDLTDSQNLTYVYEMSGFTFGLSYAIEGGDVDATEAGSFGVMFGYEIDGFSGTIAYNDNDSSGNTAYGLRLGYSTDMFGVAAVYIDNSTGGQGYGLEGSYTLDDLKITAVFADDGGAQNDYGIGAAYDLGGSLGLAGGIGSVNGTTVWDLGLTMKF
jgi:outer membrane protein OmpU